MWTLAIKYVTNFPAIADRKAIVWRSLKQIIRGFKLQVYGKGKRQIQVEIFLKMENERIKTGQKILLNKTSKKLLLFGRSN